MVKANHRFACTASAVIALSVLVAGCSGGKPVIFPKTELPSKPMAATEPCHDLTTVEETVCRRQGDSARTVCSKVQRNKMICDSSQQFIQRLYKERQGK